MNLYDLNSFREEDQEPASIVETPCRDSLRARSAGEFLGLEFPKRDTIIAPWLPMPGLSMIFSERGIGKTHLVIGLAVAAATGRDLLNWTVTKPHNVLLIDGEMPGALLQDRLRLALAASELSTNPENLEIVADADQPDGLHDLSDAPMQKHYAQHVSRADLIILDNLSTICRGYRENEADSWVPIQNWLLSVRRMGKCVIVVHHGNKSGGQRGTSRKEDILDTVIKLKRPPDYRQCEGARFEVEFKKTRDFHGDDAEPFEAWFRDGCWIRSSCKQSDKDIEELHEAGLSLRDIAERTGMSKSSVQRKLKGLRSHDSAS